MANDKVDDQPGLRQSDGHVEELTKKIDALERERDGLVNEIAGRKTEINKLTLAIDVLREDEPKMREKLEGLEREFERSQVATKAAEVVAARNAGLEIEVSRLSRDSVSKKSAVEEARTECAKLRTVLQEKESMVSDLKWEVEELKQAKLEIEKKARELEKKIGVLEMKEIEEKSKKIRVEEELREEIDEKEKEIRGVRHKLEKLQKAATERGLELEEWIKEKLNLQEALRESEEKSRSMKSNILKLQEKIEEAENVIRSLREKADEAVKEAVEGMDSEAKALNGLKLQWPMVAGSTGAIAAAAVVVYVCYGKCT